MLKKIFKGLFYFLAVVTVAFGLFLAYALQPGIPEEKLAKSGILTFAADAEKLPVADATKLRVVTYNMGYASGAKNNEEPLQREEAEKNLQAMVQTLKAFQPDLIFLQEVDFFAKRTFDANQMKQLAEGLGMPYGAYTITWNKKYVAWPYWPPSRHFGRVVSGEAVLSRFPINAQQLIEFPKPESNPFWYNWFYLDRIVEHLTLQTDSGTASVYNVHLEAFAESTRREQLERLSRLVKADDSPLKIVAGDFNLADRIVAGKTDDSVDHEGLLKKFSEQTQLKAAQGSEVFYSMPSWAPIKQIDHIFVSPQWQVEKSGNFADLKASDHLALWSVLRKNP